MKSICTKRRLLAPLAVAAGLSVTNAESSTPAVPQYLQERPVTRVDQPTRWVTCSWDVQGNDALAECATVLVPLDYEQPGRGDFRLFVKRRKVIGTPSAQVWVITGGPGHSSTEHIARLSHGIAELRPDIAYYAVDHRGVGGSEKLDCPQLTRAENLMVPVPAEKWPACIEHIKKTWGARLNAVTATNAARDVGTLVDKYRVKGVPVFVYGASYGTYLTRRYLHLFPHQPSGAIIEGIVNPADHYNGYDRDLTRVVDKLLDACSRTRECGGHFKEAPAAAFRRVLGSLDNGHCPALQLTATRAKAVLAMMTFGPPRALVPALVHRIERCSANDVAVVKRALAKSAWDSDGYSSALLHHVALSEQYHSQGMPPLEQQIKASTLSLGLELSYEKIYAQWPRYPRPPMAGSDPQYDGPLLMLQGALDPPTSLERASATHEHFKGSKQYWVAFPEGSHSLTGSTPTRDGSDCARSVYLQFVNHPDTAPDTRCISQILPINWSSTAEQAMQFMGTVDIWDGAMDPIVAVAP